MPFELSTITGILEFGGIGLAGTPCAASWSRRRAGGGGLAAGFTGTAALPVRSWCTDDGGRASCARRWRPTGVWYRGRAARRCRRTRWRSRRPAIRWRQGGSQGAPRGGARTRCKRARQTWEAHVSPCAIKLLRGSAVVFPIGRERHQHDSSARLQAFRAIYPHRAQPSRRGRSPPWRARRQERGGLALCSLAEVIRHAV